VLTNREWRDVSARMDSVLSAYLDGQLGSDAAQASLVPLLRQLIGDFDGTGVNSPSGGEIRADRFQNLMEGRSREDLQRGSAILRAALIMARGQSGAGTA